MLTRYRWVSADRAGSRLMAISAAANRQPGFAQKSGPHSLKRGPPSTSHLGWVLAWFSIHHHHRVPAAIARARSSLPPVCEAVVRLPPTMARVYAEVNQSMPRSYWDYDGVNISASLPSPGAIALIVADLRRRLGRPGELRGGPQDWCVPLRPGAVAARLCRSRR